MKTAILIGSTGLVGQQLLNQLLAHNLYHRVITFSRKPSGIKHDKLLEHLVDFNEIDSWKHLIVGDHLYSAMGTTLKKAGSKEKQYQIDFTFQYRTAQEAAINGTKRYALVSSTGANSKSLFFYNRIKGELELAVKKLPYNHLCIVQPSILEGKRKEERPGETMGIKLILGLNKIGLFKKHRPAKAAIVAKTMIDCLTHQKESCCILSLDKVLTFKSAGLF